MLKKKCVLRAVSSTDLSNVQIMIYTSLFADALKVLTTTIFISLVWTLLSYYSLWILERWAPSGVRAAKRT
jgi:hypothetical protein